ncbi:hypothetical protein LUZ60_012457 [Juncus effusus]|nr:hypothetical protein LUZ60_012457 [Juncus effusus]
MDDSDNFFPGMFDESDDSPPSEETSNPSQLDQSKDSSPSEEARYEEHAPIEASNSNSQPQQTEPHITPIPDTTISNPPSNSPTSNPGKYFYYDSPLYEETGIWIPVSVPPMTGTSFPDSSAPFLSSGAYFPDEEFNWDPLTTPTSSETTMWDIFTEMALTSKSKLSSLTSLNNIYHQAVSLTSIPTPLSHDPDQTALQEAWKEITTTLSQAQYGFENSILESEPVKWLPDSVSINCMLCSAKFHPIICPRHHCRFCGGIFCGDCSRTRSLLPHKFRVSEPQRVCDVCGVRLEGVQRYLMGRVSRAAQETVNDVTDLTTLRSWMNFPWGRGMEYEIYKAANSLRSYCKVGRLKGEKSIPESILKQAKGLAIITVANVGMMVTYKIGTGLVVARREDGSWSPPSAVSTFGLGWGPQAGGEITDYIIVLRNKEAVKTFCGTAHLSFGAGLGAAVGAAGRVAEADLRAGDGGYAACYTYSCSKGAFVGCAFNGSIITTRQTENSRFYGAPIKASEILLGSTPSPPAANILYQALTNLFEKIDKSDKSDKSKYNIYPALST